MIFFKFAVGELTSPQVIQSATWLTASWFVGELSCKRINRYSRLWYRSTRHLNKYSDELGLVITSGS